MQAVDKTPDSVRASVEVGGPAQPDPHDHRVVAADPAHVIEVEDLAGLGVELKRGHPEVLDGFHHGLPQVSRRRAGQATKADQRAFCQVARAGKNFQRVFDALNSDVGRLGNRVRGQGRP